MGGTVPHSIVATSFVDEEVRLYSIDLAPEPGGKSFAFRYTRHYNNYPEHITPPRMRTHEFAYGGSGYPVLQNDKSWQRPLRRLVRACDRQKASAHVVADYLAGINLKVHKLESTVGPRCFVG